MIWTRCYESRQKRSGPAAVTSTCAPVWEGKPSAHIQAIQSNGTYRNRESILRLTRLDKKGTAEVTALPRSGRPGVVMILGPPGV